MNENEWNKSENFTHNMVYILGNTKIKYLGFLKYKYNEIKLHNKENPKLNITKIDDESFF